MKKLFCFLMVMIMAIAMATTSLAEAKGVKKPVDYGYVGTDSGKMTVTSIKNLGNGIYAVSATRGSEYLHIEATFYVGTKTTTAFTTAVDKTNSKVYGGVTYNIGNCVSTPCDVPGLTQRNTRK